MNSKVKMFLDRFSVVLTDGKKEIAITPRSPHKVLKRLSNARSEVKAVYDETISNV